MTSIVVTLLILALLAILTYPYPSGLRRVLAVHRNCTTPGIAPLTVLCGIGRA